MLTGPTLDGVLGAGAATGGVAGLPSTFSVPSTLRGGADRSMRLAKNSSSQLKKTCLSSGDKLIQSIFSSSTGSAEALLAIGADRAGGGGGDTLSGRVCLRIGGGATGGAERPAGCESLLGTDGRVGTLSGLGLEGVSLVVLLIVELVLDGGGA